MPEQAYSLCYLFSLLRQKIMAMNPLDHVVLESLENAGYFKWYEDHYIRPVKNGIDHYTKILETIDYDWSVDDLTYCVWHLNRALPSRESSLEIRKDTMDERGNLAEETGCKIFSRIFDKARDEHLVSKQLYDLSKQVLEKLNDKLKAGAIGCADEGGASIENHAK